MKATFLIGKEEKLNFKYLALHVTSNNNYTQSVPVYSKSAKSKYSSRSQKQSNWSVKQGREIHILN